MPSKNPTIAFLRRIALMEGISFILLLGIAMPLKYFANIPMATKVFGWAHGVLLIILCFALLQVLMKTNWPCKRAVLVFIAALLPFGPFVLDRKMIAWEGEAS